MRQFINKVISILKKEDYRIDEKIPLTYLFFFFLQKSLSLIYGFFLFRRKNRVFVHPKSTIRCKRNIHFGNNLSIARGCFIDALSLEGIVLGENVSIGRCTNIECTGSLRSIGHGLKVGNNVGLGTHGFFGCAGGIEIGSDTILGNYVSFHSENHNYSDKNIPIRLQGVSHKGIKVGENCWIGAKVTFLDGSSVGNNCIVAAGAVVRGTYPDNCIIGGIPAKIIKYIV